MGLSSLLMKIASIFSDLLIFTQGFIGLRTVKKESKPAIKALLNLTIWFTVTHIIIVIVKLIISASYVDNYNWGAINDDHMTVEDIENMETFVYGMIIASFFLS